MLYDIVSKNDFREMMQSHCEEIIAFLFDENIEFSVLTSLSNISFEPVLPEHITKDFKPITLFTLAGYTYDSARIENNILSFEAGFGRENIGSFVSVPLYAILQIIIENTPIFINLSTPPEKEEEKKEEKNEKQGIEKSMDIFLSNPNNKKLLKKRKR
ncbi:MAG: hypothetical protein GXO12_06120 [Epsilonproteobacteria bacterium]|nr:hypothetical protein [Campylobacterota bacterium]